MTALKRTYTTLALFLKPQTDTSQTLFKDLAHVAEVHHLTVVTCSPEEDVMPQVPFPRSPVDALNEENTLALVLGGDGTFLNAGRLLFGKNIPVVGVNLGHVGFLTDIAQENLVAKIEAILKRDYTIEERPYMEAHIDGEIIPFFNDAVMNRMPQHKMLSVEVRVGDEVMTQRRGDGIILATPTGSTAYNLSAGGPIVHPSVNALVMTPLSPHTLTFRPVILPMTKPVTLTLKTPEALLSLDGRETRTVHEGCNITLTQSAHSLRMIHSRKMSYFDLLRTKLNWDKE